MDAIRNYHIGSDGERQIYITYIILKQYKIWHRWTYLWNRVIGIENRLMAVKEKGGWERDELGVWDERMQTGLFRMNKQGLTIWHRELNAISYDKPW